MSKGDEHLYQYPPLCPPDPWWFTMMVQHLAERSRRDFGYRMPTGDCHDDTGSWVQSAQDAIFARLHRGDDPACDCGASDA